MWKQYDNMMFDLYGTLIDIHTDEHGAATWKRWCKWLDAHGVKREAYYKMNRRFWEMDAAARREALAKGNYQVPEIDIVPIYRKMFAAYGNPEWSETFLNELSYAFREASRSYYRLYPGVKEFLQARHREGKKLYLLSNAQASYTLPEFRALGLDKLMDDWMISSDELCMKPDVAFYHKLMHKHHLDPKRTVMLGDSFENDVKGARAAGLNAIHLASENTPQTFYIRNL